MSYYGQDQQNWHQHSQTTPNYNTNAPLTQANGTNTQTNNQRQPIGPVINQAVGNIVNDLKSNMDKEYFKTTCGLLSCIEVVSLLNSLNLIQ